MPLRPTITRASRTLAAVVALLLPACSSDQPRDQWYGTDAGVGYVAPDVPLRADRAPDDADTSKDLSDGVAIDGSGSPDAAVDSSSDSSEDDG
jgi:hypothetical protein